MGLTFSLKRFEEVAVPSWPFAATRTAVPLGIVWPAIPLIKVAVMSVFPIRMVLPSPATPLTLAPMSMLLSPVVRLLAALRPKAVLLLPVVLLKSALSPTAVLTSPSVLLLSAESPLAVLPLPTVLPKSA
jgi:hypothetical protein